MTQISMQKKTTNIVYTCLISIYYLGLSTTASVTMIEFIMEAFSL